MANLTVYIKKTNDENYGVNTYNGLDEVVSHSQSTAQPKEIFYGVVASEGSFSAIDNNGEIRRLIENGELQISNAKTNIYANADKKAEHISIDSDYTEDNVYSVQLTDKLANWDKINYNGRALSSATSLYVVLSDILTAVGYGTAQIDQMLTETIFVGNSLLQNAVEITIKDYLQAITVQYPYLKKSTLKQAIQKVCEVAQLNVYLDNNGNVKFTSARPKAVSTGVCQNISPSMQMELPKKDVLLKNKYDGIELDEVNVKTNYEYSVTIFGLENYIPQDTYEQSAEDYHTREGGTVQIPYIISTYGHLKLTYARIPVQLTTFPKQNSDKTQNIVKALSGFDDKGNPNINFEVSYKKKTGTVTSSVFADNRPTYQDLVINYDDEYNGKGAIPQTYEDYYVYDYDFGSQWGSIPIHINKYNDTQYKNIEVQDAGFTFTFAVDLLIGVEQIAMNSGGIAGKNWGGIVETYIPQNVSIYVLGNKYTISFDELQSASINVANAQTVAKLPHNELLQATATYNGVKMSQIIANNVLDDYERGIPTSIVKAFALDGVSFKVGDYVQVSKDGIATPLYERADGKRMLFKVTGVNYIYNGFTSQELELQAVNDKEYDSDIIYVYNASQNAYNVGTSSSAYLNGVNKLFTLPKTLTLNNYKNLPIYKIEDRAFDSDTLFPIDTLKFENTNLIYLGSSAISQFAKKIIFNCNINSQGSGSSIDLHRNTIIEFTENVSSLVGSLFGRQLGQDGTGTFVFRHSASQNISLNNLRGSKNSAVVTIYADNEIVKNFDWSSVNITATIRPLSEWVD